MPHRDVVIGEVRRLFGDDLEALAERLSAIGESDAPDFSGLDPSRRPELLLDGATGLRKLSAGHPGQVTDAEVIGLEAIIALEGRPAFFLKDGDLLGVPERWRVLLAERDAIRASIARVGRIEVTGHPDFGWIGTGFLAGPGVVITARHVAREFARPESGEGWRFRAGMSASLDLNREQHATEQSEFAITGIIGTPIDPANLRRAFRALIKAAGIPTRSPPRTARSPTSGTRTRCATQPAATWTTWHPAQEGRRHPRP
jgi:hypothetical protein